MIPHSVSLCPILQPCLLVEPPFFPGFLQLFQPHSTTAHVATTALLHAPARGMDQHHRARARAPNGDIS